MCNGISNGLQSLDLEQSARAHLISSLLKIKAIAESPDLPPDFRRGVTKPDLPQEEQIAFHNVTSGLFNRDPVKKAVERAVKVAGDILGVTPQTNGKRSRKDSRTEQEDQPADRIIEALADSEPVGAGDAVEDESEWEGFSTSSEARAAPAQMDIDSDADADADADVDENEYSQLDNLLGSSSDEDEDWDSAKYDKFRGKEEVDLDDISLSGSGDELEVDGEESEEKEVSESSSRSVSPIAQPKKSKARNPAGPVGPTRDSTFLPSLMGGYISGSESASDIEEAKPKKRLGQRQRQAIWEKKFGSGAKHLHKPAAKGGRDAGWDMKRGAVAADDQGGRNPWKKGVRNPLGQRGPKGSSQGGGDAPPPPPRLAKKDDEGPLHPSWEARKKAKESRKSTAFSGQKVVFD